MSLSRAFTTRRWKTGNDSEGSVSSFISMPKRNNTTKAAGTRLKISAPIQLLHTTNMLSYSAPDVPRAYRSNSATSKSEDDSDTHTNFSTPPTSPDVSPSERYASPAPEPNHLTCYFQAAAQEQHQQTPDPNAPAIPRRSPSHTKKASYEALARKRSVSRMSRDSEHSNSSRVGQTFSRASSTSTRPSSASHTSTPVSPKPISQPTTPVLNNPTKEQHPFGQELAQVSELAEEYGVCKQLNSIVEEEEQYLEANGLVKLSADDYLGAIHSLAASFFPERKHAAPAPLWV